MRFVRSGYADRNPDRGRSRKAKAGAFVLRPSLVPVFRAALLLGPAADDLTLYVYAVCSGLGEDAPGQSRLFVVGRIAEVGFGGPYVLGVHEREFARFGNPECRVGQFVPLFGGKPVRGLVFCRCRHCFPLFGDPFREDAIFRPATRLSSELRPDYPIRVATMRRPEARLRNSQR